MKIITRETESALLNGPVLMLEDWKSAEEILQEERDILNKFQPRYIYCAVVATDLATIQQLEDHGYRFSEFRIQSRLFTAETDISTRSFYPYQAELITDPDDLERAVDILLSTRHDDRFSNDPTLGADFSTRRIEANLRKSFHNWPNEFLLGLYNTLRGELVGFRSGAFLSKTEAHYYQYGIKPGLDFEHTAGMLEAFTIEFLASRGTEIINVVSTGFNTPELNRLLKNYDFRITSTQVLMRKVFGERET